MNTVLTCSEWRTVGWTAWQGMLVHRLDQQSIRLSMLYSKKKKTQKLF